MNAYLSIIVSNLPLAVPSIVLQVMQNGLNWIKSTPIPDHRDVFRHQFHKFDSLFAIGIWSTFQLMMVLSLLFIQQEYIPIFFSVKLKCLEFCRVWLQLLYQRNRTAHNWLLQCANFRMKHCRVQNSWMVIGTYTLLIQCSCWIGDVHSEMAMTIIAIHLNAFPNLGSENANVPHVAQLTSIFQIPHSTLYLRKKKLQSELPKQKSSRLAGYQWPMNVS